ncbi:hypothetical protein FRC09_001778 [Ceratobasidium sp. 395]|nr:hypothetical protein FRC09_001778 [Ceratobasidium sp. 395]
MLSTTAFAREHPWIVNGLWLSLVVLLGGIVTIFAMCCLAMVCSHPLVFLVFCVLGFHVACWLDEPNQKPFAKLVATFSILFNSELDPWRTSRSEDKPKGGCGLKLVSQIVRIARPSVIVEPWCSGLHSSSSPGFSPSVYRNNSPGLASRCHWTPRSTGTSCSQPLGPSYTSTPSRIPAIFQAGASLGALQSSVHPPRSAPAAHNPPRYEAQQRNLQSSIAILAGLQPDLSHSSPPPSPPGPAPTQPLPTAPTYGSIHSGLPHAPSLRLEDLTMAPRLNPTPEHLKWRASAGINWSDTPRQPSLQSSSRSEYVHGPRVSVGEMMRLRLDFNDLTMSSVRHRDVDMRGPGMGDMDTDKPRPEDVEMVLSVVSDDVKMSSPLVSEDVEMDSAELLMDWDQPLFGY